MSDVIKDPEYVLLLEKYFDEDMSAEELTRFQSILESSPDVFYDFLETVNTHEDCRSYWEYLNESSRGELNKQRDRLKVNRRHVSRRLRRQEYGTSDYSAWKVALTIAASLLVIIGLQIALSKTKWANNEDPELTYAPVPVIKQVIASLSSSGEGVMLQRNGAWMPMPENGFIRSGDTLRVKTAEEARIMYVHDHTSVRFEKGALARFESTANGERMLLIRGQLESQIAKQSKGKNMIFQTSQLEAIIVGTKIKMSSARGKTRLEVLEGKVEVINKENQKREFLGELEAISAGQGAEFEKQPIVTDLHDQIGKMSGMILWLDGADLSNMETNNGRLTRWLDKSPGKHDAVQLEFDRMPQIIDSVMGNNSVVRFSSREGQFMELGDMDANGKASWTHFMVIKPNNVYKDSKILGGEHGFQIGIAYKSYLHTEFFMERKSGTAKAGLVELLTFHLDQKKNTARLFKNGQLISSTDFSGERWLGGRVSGDRSNRDAYYDGDIAELISFNIPLQEKARELIEKYLILKWGLEN